MLLNTMVEIVEAFLHCLSHLELSSHHTNLELGLMPLMLSCFSSEWPVEMGFLLLATKTFWLAPHFIGLL